MWTQIEIRVKLIKRPYCGVMFGSYLIDVVNPLCYHVERDST